MHKDERGGAMDLLTTAVVMTVLLAPGPAEAQPLEISRGGSRVVRQAPRENFTGVARVDRLFGALNSSDASGGVVAFEPGARTAWHSHPGGQTLIVTAGTGRVQRWGDAVQEIRSGDVVSIPPGQKHWHGASPQSSMTHLAITEPRGGSAVQWMEQVSDEQYRAAPASETTSAQARPEQHAALPPPTGQTSGRPSGDLQQRLAPGLASLTDDVLYGDVWRRPDLSPRDRSLVTIAILIATGKTAQLAGHLSRGFENGLLPGETSGLLAHLAIYCGWPSAVSALQVYEQVYAARKVDTAALRVVAPRVPPPPSNAGRPPALDESVAAVAPKFAQLTADVVFGDLWQRSDLAPRDRSLITIAALAASGDDEQLEFYLRRALETGLTRAQIAEAVTHLGFYAGWGKATTAMAALASVSQGAASTTASGNAKAEQEVIALSKEKWRLMSERNVEALGALFHDGSVFVHMGGTMSKTQELNVIKSGGIHYKEIEIQDVSVRLIGTTAILLNRIRLVAVVGGNEVVNPFMVTEVYVQQGGAWKLGSLSFTRLLTPP